MSPNYNTPSKMPIQSLSPTPSPTHSVPSATTIRRIQPPKHQNNDNKEATIAIAAPLSPITSALPPPRNTTATATPIPDADSLNQRANPI